MDVLSRQNNQKIRHAKAAIFTRCCFFTYSAMLQPYNCMLLYVHNILGWRIPEMVVIMMISCPLCSESSAAARVHHDWCVCVRVCVCMYTMYMCLVYVCVLVCVCKCACIIYMYIFVFFLFICYFLFFQQKQ